MYVPPFGYCIESKADSMLAMSKYLLKSNTSSGLVEKSTIPTWVLPVAISKAAAIFFTKSRHRWKFPVPYASMLPEPSMRKPRSTGATQAVEENKDVGQKTYDWCEKILLDLNN